MGIISGVLLTFCCGNHTSISKLGEEISTTLIKLESQRSLILGNGKILNSYEVSIDNIAFLIAVDSNDVLMYISTIDSNFVTPEGLRVGMPIKNAIEIASNTLEKKVWTHFTEYYVTLPSGWIAVVQSKEKPNLDEPIQDLLKNYYMINE